MSSKCNAAERPIIGDPRLWAVFGGEDLEKGACTAGQCSCVLGVYRTRSRGYSSPTQKRRASPESRDLGAANEEGQAQEKCWCEVIVTQLVRGRVGTRFQDTEIQVQIPLTCS